MLAAVSCPTTNRPNPKSSSFFPPFHPLTFAPQLVLTSLFLGSSPSRLSRPSRHHHVRHSIAVSGQSVTYFVQDLTAPLSLTLSYAVRNWQWRDGRALAGGEERTAALGCSTGTGGEARRLWV
jgi:hypothetical protein